MRTLIEFRVSWRDRRRVPLGLYWAKPGRFTAPGLHLWVWSRHFRIVPVRRPTYP